MFKELRSQLYTPHGKYNISVFLDDIEHEIAYSDPERRSDFLYIGKDATLTLQKHGWIFSDFWVTDLKNSPPLWKHKMTLFKFNGLKLEKAYTAWKS